MKRAVHSDQMAETLAPQTRPSERIIKDLFARLGRPTKMYARLVEYFRRENAPNELATANMFCQLLFWTPRATCAGGWIFKSTEEWSAETGLTYKQQYNARRVLKRLGLIGDRYDRDQHRLYFRVVLEAVDALCRAPGAPSHRKMPPSHRKIALCIDDGRDEKHHTTSLASASAASRSHSSIISEIFDYYKARHPTHGDFDHFDQDKAAVEILLRRMSPEQVKEVIDELLTRDAYELGESGCNYELRFILRIAKEMGR